MIFEKKLKENQKNSMSGEVLHWCCPGNRRKKHPVLDVYSTKHMCHNSLGHAVVTKIIIVFFLVSGPAHLLD